MRQWLKRLLSPNNHVQSTWFCRGRITAWAKEHGFEVLFLLKFHCELNPIEQCWEYAKGVYRQNLPSSTEADLEKNTVMALDAVSVISIRRFGGHANHFMQCYTHGMDGKLATYVAKKYCSHRSIPKAILNAIDTLPTDTN
jgi:hypothetical protein